MAVKIRCVSPFQIGKEAPDPRGEMCFEDLHRNLCRRCKLAAGQSGHDLAKNSGVILGLHQSFGAFDTVCAEILAAIAPAAAR